MLTIADGDLGCMIALAQRPVDNMMDSRVYREIMAARRKVVKVIGGILGKVTYSRTQQDCSRL